MLEVEQGEKQEGVRLEGQLVEEEEEEEEGEVSNKDVNAAENAEEERTEKVEGLAAASSECWRHAPPIGDSSAVVRSQWWNFEPYDEH